MTLHSSVSNALLAKLTCPLLSSLTQPFTKPFASPARRLIAVLLVMAGAFGCATPKPVEEHAWVVRDGMTKADTGGRGLLYVKAAHELGRYDYLMIEGIGFRYHPYQEPLHERQEEEISKMLLNAIKGRHGGTVGITDEPGPCVVKVNFYLTDLQLYQSDLTGSTTSYVSSFGSTLMVMELRDSMTDEPLARFLQLRNLGGGTDSGFRGANLHRLGRTIGSAMREMGSQLQEVIPPTTRFTDTHSCNMGMTRVALGAH